MTCSIANCETQAVKRGWCEKHYQRWKKWGDPNRIDQIRGDHRTRFESYITEIDGHRLWSGNLSWQGYGVFWDGQRDRKAHVWAWEQVHGSVAEGLELDHLCRVRACVEVSHLEAITHQENVTRSGPATKLNCKRGHAYADSGYLNNQNHRACRICDVIRRQKVRQ